MTKQELYNHIIHLKTRLEIKINFSYLPLQRKRNELFEKTDFKKIMELETVMEPLKNEIANEYDEILRLKKEYIKLFTSQ